jgi:hypothetical protein
MMDRSALRQFLDREQVDPRSYGLDGASGVPVQDREERYFLEEVPSGWSVYYWERGLRSGEQSFDTEDEACNRLLDLLLRDRTTRMK